MNNKRLIIGLMVGALLGVVCIIGAQTRSGAEKDTVYLFAFWYNRLLMGGVIGLIGFPLAYKYKLLRGAIIGIAVSFMFYVTTSFSDHIGFVVGAVYGIIIEAILDKFKV
ncbi:MAG: hypothetical protein ACOC1L_01160 [Bacillota bacterium]